MFRAIAAKGQRTHSHCCWADLLAGGKKCGHVKWWKERSGERWLQSPLCDPTEPIASSRLSAVWGLQWPSRPLLPPPSAGATFQSAPSTACLLYALSVHTAVGTTNECQYPQRPEPEDEVKEVSIRSRRTHTLYWMVVRPRNRQVGSVW